MKRIFFFICPLIFSCGSGGVLENGLHNVRSGSMEVEKKVEEDFIKTFSVQYTIVKNDLSGDSKGNNELVKETGWSLKSKQPVRKDEEGNYYYRWYVNVEEYASDEGAVKAYNKTFEELSKANKYETLGRNCRYFIYGKYILSVSAACLEGRHVGEWFAQLQSCLLRDQKPEKNTAIICTCGGAIKLE
ncbi:MAG TPA: hypothetical protein VI112_00235 [Bacteroidia bacterium]|jgi:hypothetical protein